MNARDDEHLILFPPKRGEALARLEAFVPHAAHGFFRFRQQIPELIACNGLGTPEPLSE